MARRLTSLLAALLLATVAHGQVLLNKFGPSTGILVGVAGNPATSAAGIADIQPVLSTTPGLVLNGATGGAKGAGTVNATGLYVNGSAVGVGGGAVSSVGLTMPTCFGVTGSPVTSSGSLGATLTGTKANMVLADGTCGNSIIATAATTGLTITGSGAGDELLAQCNSTNSANLRCWSQRVGSGPNGAWTLQPELDNLTLGNSAIVITRDTSANVTGVFFANTTDNAPTTFQGTGLVTAGGSLTVAGQGIFHGTQNTNVGLTVLGTGGVAATASNGLLFATSGTGGTSWRLNQPGVVSWDFINAATSGTLCITSAACGDGIFISPAGNVGVQAPSSGIALSITAASGAAAFSAMGQINSIASSSSSVGQVLVETPGGSNIGNICISATANICETAIPANYLDLSGSTGFQLTAAANSLITGNSTGLQIHSAVGTGLAITGNASGANAVVITATGGTNQSFGLAILAGTSSSDHGLQVLNQSGSTNYFNVFGDGGITVGAPSGGDLGIGKINAVGLYINGVAVSAGGVFHAACYVTISGTTPTLVNNTGCSGVTRSGTGNYQVTFNAGFTARPDCTTVGYGGGYGGYVNDPSSNTVMQFEFASLTTGVQVDPTGFMVNCVGL